MKARIKFDGEVVAELSSAGLMFGRKVDTREAGLYSTRTMDDRKVLVVRKGDKTVLVATLSTDDRVTLEEVPD